MKPVAFVLGTILAAFILTAPAQQREKTRSLSLEECIRVALEHNLAIQISRLDPQLAGFRLSGSYGVYDPTLRFGARHAYELSPGGIDTQTQLPFPSSETESDNINSSLTGLLPWGLNYNLGINLTDTYGTRPFTGPFDDTFGNLGVFTMSQPLLKDSWIDAERLQIFINKKGLKSSELGLRNQIIITVTDVESAYYNLMFQDESVKVQEKALELAERLVAENRRRVEVGALAPLDEKQAESQAARSRADLLAARADRETAERVLKALLSDDYNDWMDVRIEPSEALLALPQILNLQESWRKGMEQRPDLLQARLTIEIQTRQVSYQQNQLYPQLDLTGAFGFGASEDEFSSALGALTSRNSPSHSYGVVFSIPLANTGARNAYKTAKVTKEQNQLQLRQAEQRSLILIENSMANARISYERVSVTHQATQFAEEALKAEQTKLEKGKSTSFVVLQLQNELTARRSEEIRALADYNINLAVLAREEGSTLERRKIDLEFK